MVREFKIINEKNEEFSLMDIHNACLLTDPSGLGESYNTEYEQLGNTFIANLRKIEQGQINGQINFLSYDNFKKFIDFIESAESLKFSYKIPFKDSIKEYFKDIQIQSITKSEIKTINVISEDIVINCLTLWYEENTTTYTIEPLDDEIRWNFRWDSRFMDYNTRVLEFVNQGHIEAPIMVEIQGHIVNPRIELYVEDELYQTVTFNVDIAEYEKFLYGTKENEFYIYRQKTNGDIESLFDLDVIDFSNDNVIRVPKNKQCKIKLKADNQISNAQITVLVFYKVV